MLTDKQWNYLIAVAKEGCVSQIHHRGKWMDLEMSFIFHVRFEALDGLGWKILGETKVLKTVDGTPQTAVVGDGLRLKEIDVRMPLQFVE